MQDVNRWLCVKCGELGVNNLCESETCECGNDLIWLGKHDNQELEFNRIVSDMSFVIDNLNSELSAAKVGIIKR